MAKQKKGLGIIDDAIERAKKRIKDPVKLARFIKFLNNWRFMEDDIVEERKDILSSPPVSTSLADPKKN